MTIELWIIKVIDEGKATTMLNNPQRLSNHFSLIFCGSNFVKSQVAYRGIKSVICELQLRCISLLKVNATIHFAYPGIAIANVF